MASHRRCGQVFPILIVLALAVTLQTPCLASESRIVGGVAVDGSSTKHQVSVRARSADQIQFGRGHICGGSLINLGTVLTAAHCLVDDFDRARAATYFRVVGGGINRTVQTANTVVRDVRQVVVHANYVSRGFLNDVGLLMLASNVPSGHPTLQPIAMTTQVPANNTRCQTSGWGSTYYNGPSSDVLLAVNISIIAKATCNALSSYAGSIGNGMLCAGDMNGGLDACQGDSGGPLVCNGLLVGVVSHGVECARARYPGVYADVAYYRTWVGLNHSAVTPRPPGGNGRGPPLLTGSLSLLLTVVGFTLHQQFSQQ
ncbi:trypsin eta-like [Anopheles ziemanni]|uniref:trypsin eta-like n=1 Tax=Anopheles coustani TaxID=139045 RepID=UPI00265A2C7F|nr:trypsin eta-like [Anopheles coustani]XP_058176283.1 trypsin eta-like [Anopheles ziemanni]